MEILGYIHHALIYEESVNIPKTHTLKNLQLFQGVSRKKLSSHSRIYFLLLAVLLDLISITNQASAALQQGSSGNEVIALQQRLQQLGYFNAKITGYFGCLTKDAVNQFQEYKGLKSNGIVDTKTYESLFEKSEASKSKSSAKVKINQKDTFSAIKTLQKSLKTANYYHGDINGVFDIATLKAVKDFQKAKGLKANGIVDEKTKVSLGMLDNINNNSNNNNSQVLELGNHGSRVKLLQQLLKKLGYFQGKTTGYFGSQTQAAVIKFQESYKINADGVVGENTLLALTKANG